ncbi:MAG: phosphatase PAP2 family protein [Hyphomonadaceae bacterium]
MRETDAPSVRSAKRFAVPVFCAAGFAATAYLAANGAAAPFDEHLLVSLREAGDITDPIGPVWFEEAARDVTALGGTFFLTLLTLSFAAAFLINASPRLALFSVAAVVGATVMSEGLKALFDRARPALVPHEVSVYSASFPSGHTMMAAAVFFTLAFALAREMERRRNRTLLYAIAALMAFLVGASRVYLGVHWPSDVLAGWFAGIAYAAIAAQIYRALASEKR